MPKLIGKATRVVEHDGLSIDELAGNVATSEDTLSIARVVVTAPSSEPWLTLDYDEWICVLKGKIEFHHGKNGDEVITATAGQTIFVAKGERFRPMFPEGDTEYIPVCLPAFKPERCLREEDTTTSQVSQRLNQLHNNENGNTNKNGVVDNKTASEQLYHMCQKSLWDKAVEAGVAYYPPTFEQDGNFTHATAVPQRLIETANHFYTSVVGDWICLELSRTALKDKAGIITTFEDPKPVGTTDIATSFDGWICPHIFGGIPGHIPGVVAKTFPMKRDANGNFLCIDGLTN